MTYKVTADHIKAVSNTKDAQLWADLFNNLMPSYGIKEEVQVKMFLAQCSHESAGFKVLEENLNYSATALNKTFAKYFKNAGRDAKEYARKPEKIANLVYASRMGNGGVETGDGYKHRGRGVIQLTGKTNYTLFAKDLDMTVDEAIEYLETPAGAAESACWFWKKNHLNDYANKGDFRGLTKRINGGYNGMKHRQELYDALNPSFVAPAASPSVQEDVSSIARSLGVGDRGADVAMVQRKLGLADDGIFGPNTHRAVKKFQRANGLIADGIVGPATLGKL